VDIQKLGERADLRPVLREYVEGLASIHARMREKLATPVGEAEALIEDGIARFRRAFPDETPLVGLHAVERAERGNWSHQTPLTALMIERWRHLLQRNDSLVNLVRRHVSSEPD